LTTSADASFADAVLSEAGRQAATAPGVRRADLSYVVVTAVNADGTVSVGDIKARRFAETYAAPAVGDQVVLGQAGNGNWYCFGRLASLTDTGTWVPLTLGAGMSWPGHGAVPGCLREGKRITLRGRVGATSGNIADGATILTLPAAVRPAGAATASWASPRNAPAGSNPQPNVCRVDITTAGIIRTFEAGNPPSWVSLDFISYFTD